MSKRNAAIRQDAKRRFGCDLRDARRLMEVHTAVAQSLERYVTEEVRRVKNEADIAERQRRELQRVKELFDETWDRIEAAGVVTESDVTLVAAQLQRFAAVYSDVTAAYDKVKRSIRTAPPMVTPADTWEMSGHTDVAALRAMLAPFKSTLPPLLLDGINESLERLQRRWPPDYRHILRWQLVFEGRHIKRLTWPKACTYASEQLTGTSAGGGPETMWKSYKRVRGALRRQGKNDPLEVTPNRNGRHLQRTKIRCREPV